MGIENVWRYMKGTIQDEHTQTVERSTCSLDPVSSSYSERSMQPHSLFGESLLITQDNRESTVPCFETKANINQVSLSDKLTESLISAGLVKGIIPTSMRKRLDQQILDIAFLLPDGNGAEEQKTD